MVRIKHRYLLLDILYPTTTTTSPPTPTYLTFHAPTPDTFRPGLLAKLLRERIAFLYGDWGVGKLGGSGANGVSVKYLSPATSTAIVRCPRASYRIVWAALTDLSSIPVGSGGGTGLKGSRECVFRVVRVSGTMRKAEEEAIRRARREIVRTRRADEMGLEEVVGGSGGGGRTGDEEGNLFAMDVDDAEDEDEDEDEQD